MLDHHTNAGFMQFEIFAKGERFSHQIGTPLPQCVVQSLDMIGFTGLFRHLTVTGIFSSDRIRRLSASFGQLVQ
jgi:hypothetical protein